MRFEEESCIMLDKELEYTLNVAFREARDKTS